MKRKMSKLNFTFSPALCNQEKKSLYHIGREKGRRGVVLQEFK